MAKWYSRPVFFVTDLERAMQFYGSVMDFTEAWRYEEGGKVIVAEMRFGGCELILAIDARRAGKSRLFISLEEEEMDDLKLLIAERQITTKPGWWGYPVIEIRDPDGNELLFPVEEDAT